MIVAEEDREPGPDFVPGKVCVQEDTGWKYVMTQGRRPGNPVTQWLEEPPSPPMFYVVNYEEALTPWLRLGAVYTHVSNRNERIQFVGVRRCTLLLRMDEIFS